MDHGSSTFGVSFVSWISAMSIFLLLQLHLQFLQLGLEGINIDLKNSDCCAVYLSYLVSCLLFFGGKWLCWSVFLLTRHASPLFPVHSLDCFYCQVGAILLCVILILTSGAGKELPAPNSAFTVCAIACFYTFVWVFFLLWWCFSFSGWATPV